MMPKLSSLFCLLALAGSVHAQSISTPGFSFANGSTNSGNFVVGYQFLVNKTITVTELGKHDMNGGGLNEAAQVGLWKTDGTLLTSATVPAGTAGTLRNQAYFTPITSVTLTPGHYIIGAQTFASGEPFIVGSGSITAADGLAWYGARFNSGTTLASPATVSTVYKAYFGPTFSFTSDRGTNLLVNASFEANAVANGNFLQTSAVSNWTVSGNVVLANDWQTSNYAANDQANWLSLEDSGTGPNRTLSQTFATNPGQLYEYSFECSALDDTSNRVWTLTYSIGATTNTVSINSGYAGNLLLRAWRTVSGTFVATDTSTTISFTGDRQRDGFYGPAIDQVWVGTALPASETMSGQWKFDSNHDDSVSANNGTFVGAEVYTNGFVNQCVTLNGSNYLNVGPNAMSTNAYTKTAWIRRTGAGNNNILGGDTTSSQHAFFVPQSYGYQLASGHNGAWNTVRDNFAIPVGVWTHVAVTYDRTENGGTLRLYRNGHLAGGTSVVTNVAPPNGGAALIGGFSGPGNGLIGQLDEVGLWDHALTAAEIEQIYKDAVHAHCRAYDLVPEMANFDVVYELAIPTQSTLGSGSTASYAFDNSDIYTNGVTFDRLAYYMQLATNGASTSQWVCVSLDPFTTDVRKIGVPAYATGASFQQPVMNLNIYAGGNYVATGTNIQTGNIEFWGINYTAVNSAAVPNASDSLYDVGDQPVTSGYYGSMQLHNHAVTNTTATQTLFAYNHWGTGSNSDLGIGNDPNTGRANYSPDWTFAQNANIYTDKVLVVLARKLLLPVVAMGSMPKSMQLYPRDLDTSLANVTIAGAVLSSNCTDVSVAVTRAGSAYTNVTQSLVYFGNQAPFAFSVPILAELAGYDFTVQVTSNGTPYTVATATNVVAGDVLLINGQSNAEARSFNGSANGEQSNWVRSYGYRSSSSAEVTADAAWHLAEGDAVHGAGAVGQWGLRMGRVLMESNGIPICVMNNAEGGQPISYFQCNDSAPNNPAINYGQTLYRVQQSGLQNAVRAILWFQGESDGTAATTHESGWLELYRHWLRDYPTLEKVYVCQLHAAACGGANIDLRNRQRIWPDTYDKIEVMSMTGIPQHTDNCHYAWATGYKVLGEQLARLTQRDLYGTSLPSQIAPPNIECAYLADLTGLNVTIVTRNPEDQLGAGSGIGSDFTIEGLPGATVLLFSVASNTVQLTFSTDVRLGTGLSFTNHFGGAPYLTNSLGMGLLSFYKQPILASLTTPDVPANVQTVSVSSNRIDLSWGNVTNAAHYLIRRDSVIIGTAYQPFFIDTLTGTHLYEIATVSPAGTSSWSTVVFGATAVHNVFVNVAEAADYDVLYELDLLNDFQVGSTLDVSYSIDNSGIYTAGIQRVAYYMELQDQPGNPLRWVYASMTGFTNNPAFLGVPVVAKGKSFQIYAQDMNVYASTNTGIVTGQHLATGNLEFWGYNYAATNAGSIPGASNTGYDFGDQINTGGTYGSMQLHNYGTGQTLFAFNRWGAAGIEDIGIGNCTFTNADWTFAGNAQAWDVKRLYVLALVDADGDGIPDAWLQKYFGHRTGDVSDLSRSTDDADGDGQSNIAEYLAGTHPLLSTSAFTPQQGQKLPEGFRITWGSVPGKSYDIEFKDVLVPGNWNSLTSNIPASAGNTTSLTDTNAVGLPQRFYQIKLRQP